MTKKLKITVLGTTYEVLVEEVEETQAASKTAVAAEPSAPLYVTPKKVTKITAPLSGTVSGIAVSVGTEVHSGDALCTIEAMTMQNVIPAPTDGVVSQIHIRADEDVDLGDLLITLE